MTAPDLKDPLASAAYRRELQGVGRPIRHTGIAFGLLGVVLAVVRREWLPAMPAIIPIAALGLAVINMLAGVVFRARYHQERMRG